MATGSAAGAGGAAGGGGAAGERGASLERYTKLLALIRAPGPWLPLALCEAIPVEQADRLVGSLIELLSVHAAERALRETTEEVL